MKKIAYTNCTLLDGTSKDMQPQENMAVIVEGEKIVDVCKAADVPADAEKEDLDGAYLMPGLINLHAHLPAGGKPMKGGYGGGLKNGLALLKKMALGRKIMRSLTYGNAQKELYGGVTTVRAVGGLHDSDTFVRDQINKGKKVGPRILAANEAVAPPNGHMGGTVAKVCETKEDAVKMVADLVDQKPDLIKLMITGGVLDAKEVGEPPLRMEPDWVKACCDKAHELGFQVAAHVESAEGVKVALENGVDTIEHGAVLTPEIIQLFKDRDAALICTISPAVSMVFFGKEMLSDPLYLENGKIVFEGLVKGVKAARENGINIGLGNDVGCPYVDHSEFWRELVYFSDWVGTSPAEAIYTATMSNAKIVGLDKVTGSIEAGKDADFIVLKKNPLDDLCNLRNPELVCARGHVVKNPPYNVPQDTQDHLDAVMHKPVPENVNIDL